MLWAVGGQIMNQFERKSHEYKTIKHWKLIQQDSRKLVINDFIAYFSYALD